MREEYFTKSKLFKVMKAVYINGQRDHFQLVQYIYCPQFYANMIWRDAWKNIKDGNGEPEYFCIEEVEMTELEKKELSLFNGEIEDGRHNTM